MDSKNGIKDISHTFIMEETGIYYESLAYYLHRLNKKVCVLLPTKVKYYAKSLTVKTKTDKIDAKIISRMGAEYLHPLWIPPSPILKEL